MNCMFFVSGNQLYQQVILYELIVTNLKYIIEKRF